FRSAQVGADQFVFAAGIEKAVRLSRMSADLRGKNLRAVSWFESSRRSGCANEFAFFGENEQLIACEGDCGCAEIILFPANFAGLEFDATKACGWFQAGIGSAVDAIK